MEPKVLEPKTIGERIRIVREIFGMTQKEFAQRLHITQAHISKLEKGNDRSSALLMKLICMEFRISADWLVKGEGPMYAAKHADERMTLDEAAAPLIRWMKQNGDPDAKVIVDAGGVWLAHREGSI